MPLGTAFEPDQSTVAVQVVALVLLHVNVVEPPLDTMVGLALKVTVGIDTGAGPTVTVTTLLALPLTLLHDRV